MPEHGVEDHQQLAHAGCEGHLLRLARGQEPLVEVLMTGLQRVAVNAPMYREVRTLARPPQTVRLPLIVPLSRLKGATPTRAAICLRFSVPSSGRYARRVRETCSPTP